MLSIANIKKRKNLFKKDLKINSNRSRSHHFSSTSAVDLHDDPFPILRSNVAFNVDLVLSRFFNELENRLSFLDNRAVSRIKRTTNLYSDRAADVGLFVPTFTATSLEEENSSSTSSVTPGLPARIDSSDDDVGNPEMSMAAPQSIPPGGLKVPNIQNVRIFASIDVPAQQTRAQNFVAPATTLRGYQLQCYLKEVQAYMRFFMIPTVCTPSPLIRKPSRQKRLFKRYAKAFGLSPDVLASLFNYVEVFE